MPAILHLINGRELRVLQSADDAALLLWGQNKGDDAHDKGFATLQAETKTVHIHPRAVMYAEPIE